MSSPNMPDRRYTIDELKELHQPPATRMPVVQRTAHTGQRKGYDLRLFLHLPVYPADATACASTAIMPS